MFVPSKNRLARNIQVLQAFFLQNLALNLVATYLASLALKMKLFLQDKNSCNDLARNNCKIIFLQGLIKSCKKIIL